VEEMDEKNDQTDVLQKELKERLVELNQKAYYLLVALSFLFVLGGKSNNSNWQQFSLPIKVALSFTLFAAVIPLQDFVPKENSFLQLVRWFKVVMLIIALAFTLFWLWTSI
jgi:uncharacterized membrane protein YjfL (UPF0719 family)